MSRHRQFEFFNTVFLGVALVSMVGVGSVNAFVDPYGIINTPEVDRINDLKPRQFTNVRLFKAADVTRIQPRTILLGSSRTELGLDPDHPALADQPAYNLGLLGSNMYEVRRYFDHALANQPDLEHVVLGIDFFMFNEFKANEVDFDESRLEQDSLQPSDVLSAVFSFNALEASVDTLSASARSDAYYLYHENGMRYVYGNQPQEPARDRFKHSIAGYFDVNGYYNSYRFSEEFLNEFRLLVETCRERNIELTVFISPSHAAQWEALRAAGLWSEFEDWKREIVEITPVWDFSGYNSITTEPIADDMQHYWDSSHYRKEVGDLVMNRLFNYQVETVPTDFGVWMTRDTVNTHLSRIRTNRSQWASANSETIAFLNTIYSERTLHVYVPSE